MDVKKMPVIVAPIISVFIVLFIMGYALYKQHEQQRARANAVQVEEGLGIGR